VANITCLKIPFPQRKEQDLIAAFIDYETAKIDALIEKQQRLVELLKEKRQAVISHAVTKGLNPNAPMKDSGAEWLGEVPAHWGVTKFHYEIDLLEGPGILANDFFDEGVPLLRIQNVKDHFVSDEYKTFLSPSKVGSKWNHFRVAQGDLIISCSASTGLVSEVGENAVGAIPYTGLIRLRPQRRAITKDFIRYLVQSDLFFEQINLLQSGSTIQHFGPYHLHQMYITLPPANEQEEIATVIKQKTARLDDLIAVGNNQIELMQERRTALISAAVTGKIDVRDWQVAA
jgi:type I restriction enzyme, S subunit